VEIRICKAKANLYYDSPSVPISMLSFHCIPNNTVLYQDKERVSSACGRMISSKGLMAAGRASSRRCGMVVVLCNVHLLYLHHQNSSLHAHCSGPRAPCRSNGVGDFCPINFVPFSNYPFKKCQLNSPLEPLLAHQTSATGPHFPASLPRNFLGT
jgi:hypothetical protein